MGTQENETNNIAGGPGDGHTVAKGTDNKQIATSGGSDDKPEGRVAALPEDGLFIQGEGEVIRIPLKNDPDNDLQIVISFAKKKKP